MQHRYPKLSVVTGLATGELCDLALTSINKIKLKLLIDLLALQQPFYGLISVFP